MCYIKLSRRNQGKILGEAEPMGGRNLSPLVNISENLGKAAALTALPLITPLFQDLSGLSM